MKDDGISDLSHPWATGYPDDAECPRCLANQDDGLEDEEEFLRNETQLTELAAAERAATKDEFDEEGFLYGTDYDPDSRCLYRRHDQ